MIIRLLELEMNLSPGGDEGNNGGGDGDGGNDGSDDPG